MSIPQNLRLPGPILLCSGEICQRRSPMNNPVTRVGVAAIGTGSLLAAAANDSPALGTFGVMSLGLYHQMSSLSISKAPPHTISYSFCTRTRFKEGIDYSELEKLHLHQSSIEEFPSDFNPPKLVRCDASVCPIRKFPENFNPPSLEELELSHTRQITSLPNRFHPPNLVSFHATNSSLQFLPDRWSAPKLEILYLENSDISSLPENMDLPKLGLLNMGNTPLTHFPEKYKFPNLTHLNLEGTHLVHFPENFNLPSLRSLNLSNTPLTSLPESILRLPRDCSVYISLLNFPTSVQNYLRNLTQQPNYSGPRFHFNMVDNANQLESEDHLEALQNLLDEVDDPSNASALAGKLLEGASNPSIVAGNLHIWLDKLFLPASAQSDNSEAFFTSAIRNLKLVSEDKELRSFFHDLIAGTTSTCGDGIVLSSIHLDNQVRALKMDASKALEVFQFLARTVYPMDVLHKTADNIIPTLPLTDPVEVYLGLPIMLKDEFEIGINIDEMLFFDCSGLADEHLTQAKNILKEALADKNRIVSFLVDQPKWREVLACNFAGEYAQALKDRDEDAASITESPLALKKFQKTLLDLTFQLTKQLGVF